MPQDPILVEVEGMGVIEFPAGTSPGQIQSTLQNARAKEKRREPSILGQMASEQPVSAPQTAAGGPATRIGPATRSLEDYNPVAGLAKGVAKGIGNTVTGFGQIAYDYLPGVSTVADAVAGGNAKPSFQAARDMLQPEGTAERIGFTGEQIGEFFTPSPAGKAKLAGEVAKSALLTQAQTGSPVATGLSAGITATIPGAGKLAGKFASVLSEGAQKSVTQALGATKEWAKSDAAKLAPQMLERGVRGSRAAMLERAEQASAEAGRRLGAAYEAAGEAGQTVRGLVVRGELQLAKDGLMTTSASGAPIPIPGAERVIKKLDTLERFVEKLGDDVPVDKAAAIKTAWDRIVAKAGLYGPKATANATDNADAWALREGSSSFRRLLQEANPDIKALSQEYAFWKGLKGVLKATELRTQAQSGGLQAALGATTGGVSGLMSGDSFSDQMTNAFVGAAAGRQFVKAVQSPWWRTTISAPLKDKLARALASGNPGHASHVWSQVLAALPSQAKQALAN